MYRMFSRDVTAAMASLKGMAGTLVSPTSPSGTELYFFFCFG